VFSSKKERIRSVNDNSGSRLIIVILTIIVTDNAEVVTDNAEVFIASIATQKCKNAELEISRGRYHAELKPLLLSD